MSIKARLQSPELQLFLSAFLILYLELALIRYVAAKALYLGYFSNFVLISAFLGMGLGFLIADRTRLLGGAPLVILFLIAYMRYTQIDLTVLRESAGQLFFGFGSSSHKVPVAVNIFVIFVSIVSVFAALGQNAGRNFQYFAPLKAYSIDIVGSLVGIAFFTLHSYLGGGPLQWFAVAFLVLALLGSIKFATYSIAAGLAVVALIASGQTGYTRWSPYQQIELLPISNGYQLLANGIGHQSMQPVGTKEPIYDYPYVGLRPYRNNQTSYRDILVIGAGSGTDTSYALHYGVQHVDAVEIDPEILKAGKIFHPARPYDSPRVSTFNTDGRAYMEQTNRRYDLIIYALPDSLAALSNLSNIRLESFLFTVESFKQARRLLKDDGVLILYNYYRRDWLVDRLAGMLQRVFGHAPLVHNYSQEDGGRLAVLAIGPQLGNEAHPVASQEVDLATDNWPFLYMQDKRIPTLYLVAIGFFIFFGTLGVFFTGKTNACGFFRYGPFLLLGAAFLLLETKAVIQFSLLFGATWLVNSLVFFAILCSVLLANVMVAHMQLASIKWPFFALLVVLIAQFVMPLDALLGINNSALRYVVASGLFFSPIFLANVVFSVYFSGTDHGASAFGWNLVGTMVGGALEYVSLAVGYHWLTAAVGILYISAVGWAWFNRRSLPNLPLRTSA